MSESDFKQVVEIISKEKYDYVYLYLSGEPYLHPKIYDFVGFLHQKSIKVNVATRLCSKIDWGKFWKFLPDILLVTLDSFQKETVELISPGAPFSLIMGNFEEFSKLWRSTERKCSLRFSVNETTANHGQLDEIQTQIEKLFKKETVSFGSRPIGIAFGCSTDLEIADAVECGKDLIDGVTRVKVENSVPVCQYHPRFWPDGKKCTMVSGIVPVIGWNGDLLPCCHDFLYKTVMGNVIEENSVDNILNSVLGRKIIEEGINMKLPICRSCN